MVEATQRDTTDVEDIQLLADEIVALIQTAAYDDMTWAEVEMAFQKAMGVIRTNWTATNSVKPAPPVTPP